MIWIENLRNSPTGVIGSLEFGTRLSNLSTARGFLASEFLKCVGVASQVKTGQGWVVRGIVVAVDSNVRGEYTQNIHWPCKSPLLPNSSFCDTCQGLVTDVSVKDAFDLVWTIDDGAGVLVCGAYIGVSEDIIGMHASAFLGLDLSRRRTLLDGVVGRELEMAGTWDAVRVRY